MNSGTSEARAVEAAVEAPVARRRPLMQPAADPSRTRIMATPAVRRPSNTAIPAPLLIMFTRQLATMYEAGVAIVRALEVLAHQTESPDFQMVIFAINSDLLKGRTFSASLAMYPRIFKPLYLSMVRVGEMEGDLGEALDRVADFLERDFRMRKQVQAAMTYPLMVFGFAVFVAFVMFNYLLPHFVVIFDQMHIELPLMTRLLMDGVRVAQSPWFMLGAPLVLAVQVVQFRAWVATDVGHYRFDRFKLRLPVFGTIFRKVAIARLARSLGTLVMAGINTIMALELAGEASGNEVVRLHMKQAARMLANGRMLSGIFAIDGQIYPPIVVHMVSAGEETGRMDFMLEKLAHYFEVEVNHALANLSTLLEPVLILFTGGMVGFIVIAIFLPLYGFINHMQ